ncbi:MAG: ABC transporter ATP-binding protein [Desulfatiglans sp.]|jgi:branched-chain amino acid transport system ATP-binding protein|nr:ABC transporter ATP-binding protein [Thermodesulfobacteriota bacterium]MEE4352061.1 ABC transporter ATP-binding protein [Desulfatiglans sp.]
MLKVNNIEVVYNEVILVLRGVFLEVPDGKIVTLLGANGAGKSTLLKAVSGMLNTELGEVTDGFIEFNGMNITNCTPEEIVRKGVVQVLEGRRLFDYLTVEQNLKVSARARKGNYSAKKKLELVYELFPRMKRLRKNISGYCSGGEQQMVVIGRALMGDPDIMLLDEPSIGLSPLVTEEIFEVIKSIHREEKIDILLVEQNATMALDMADYGYIMENGRIVLDGKAATLKENEDIKEFYLGLSQVGEKKSYRDVKHYKRRKRWLG